MGTTKCKGERDLAAGSSKTIVTLEKEKMEGAHHEKRNDQQGPIPKRTEGEGRKKPNKRVHVGSPKKETELLYIKTRERPEKDQARNTKKKSKTRTSELVDFKHSKEKNPENSESTTKRDQSNNKKRVG